MSYSGILRGGRGVRTRVRVYVLRIGSVFSIHSTLSLLFASGFKK